MNEYKKKRKLKMVKPCRRNKRSSGKVLFWDILLSISLLTVFCLMGGLLFYLSYIAGKDYSKGYDKGYSQGYSQGCTLGYEAAYPEVYNSGYWEGFLKGCQETSEEGFGRKNEIIDAYYSLLINADLMETQRIAFTYRFRQLLRAPIPKEDDAEKFISDIEEILSSDT